MCLWISPVSFSLETTPGKVALFLTPILYRVVRKVNEDFSKVCRSTRFQRFFSSSFKTMLRMMLTTLTTSAPRKAAQNPWRLIPQPNWLPIHPVR